MVLDAELLLLDTVDLGTELVDTGVGGGGIGAIGAMSDDTLTTM